MTNFAGLRGVLALRLALLGEAREGEDPALEEARQELRVRIAKLGQQAAEAGSRLPYSEES